MKSPTNDEMGKLLVTAAGVSSGFIEITDQSIRMKTEYGL